MKNNLANHFYLTCLVLFLMLYGERSLAASFPLPAANEALVGDIDFAAIASGDTTASVAHRYNLGLNAVVEANPGVTEDTVFYNETILKMPTQFLLPPLPRNGIVINLPEMRMYYFPKTGNQVLTFPVGIGKVGKTIPITKTAIVRKTTDPVWIPPKDIRAYNEERGITLPRTMPPGPDNPLGPYAIYLRIPTYLIHSTIFPESIGRRASFGCIRMNRDDIEEFYPMVEPGTTVTIIDMPNKVAWQNDDLYLEAHPSLEERQNITNNTLDGVVKTIHDSLPKNQIVLVNWQIIAYLTEEPDGIPHKIGEKIRG